jgi:hypothetical protein
MFQTNKKEVRKSLTYGTGSGQSSLVLYATAVGAVGEETYKELYKDRFQATQKLAAKERSSKGIAIQRASEDSKEPGSMDGTTSSNEERARIGVQVDSLPELASSHASDSTISGDERNMAGASDENVPDTTEDGEGDPELAEYKTQVSDFWETEFRRESVTNHMDEDLHRSIEDAVEEGSKARAEEDKTARAKEDSKAKEVGAAPCKFVRQPLQ